MSTRQQQRQHSTGSLFLSPSQTYPISIPTTVIPTQHLVHSPSAVHNSPTTMFTSGCTLHPLCSHQAGPLSPIHSQQRSSSEGANLSATSVACYYKPAEAEKKYQNVEQCEDVVQFRNSGKYENVPVRSPNRGVRNYSGITSTTLRISRNLIGISQESRNLKKS